LLNFLSLFKRLQNAQSGEKEISPAVPSSPDFQDELLKVVADHLSIQRFLVELRDNFSKVLIWPKGGDEWLPARIIAIDTTHRELAIELEGLAAPSRADWFEDQVNLSFQSGGSVALCCLIPAALGASGVAGNLRFRMQWPDWIMLNEMRLFPRIQVDFQHNEGWQEMLQFLDCQQSTVIHDVGEGGIGLRLKGATLASIADKSEITLGDVQKNQSGRQSIRLRVTHKAALGNDEHHVGTEFVEISENWRRELRKILLKLQAASAKVIR
jgi:hypothetical protein